MAKLNRKMVRDRIHRRVRKKISGTAERPRLSVHYSNQHIYVQLINDELGKTLCATSTLDKAIQKPAANIAVATQLGELLAEKAKKIGVVSVVFDRGGYLYHGKVKAFANAAREGGLTF